MTTKAFNIAAHEQQPYSFDLDREVAAFYRDHPEQKKKIFFIDATVMPGAICRGDEGDEDEVAELLGQNGHLYSAINATYKTGMGGSACYDEGYSCVILKMPRNQNNVNLLGYAAPSDITDVFSFDHEIGHLICAGGYAGNTPRMKECIADAYAVIRHFQRFGTSEDSIKNLTAMRTVEMIFGRTDSHFTAPAVEKIIADSRKIDFSALTPAETTALAQRYAVDNSMDQQLLGYIADNFGALRFNAVEFMRGDFRALRELGELTLKTVMPEEFQLGATAVRAVLDGNIGIDGIRLPKPEGPEWTKLRQKIDARADRFKQPQLKLIIPGQ